jgi:outer membrane protein OmpA-like peptidoglycan-associated protein
LKFVRIVAISALLLSAVFTILPELPAGATGSSLVSETFTGGTVAGDWTIPAGSSGVCLTAGSNTSATPIPDCGTNQSSGALQLTNNAQSQVGSVYNDVAVPMADGLDVSFDSYQFNGNGADGISIDLAAVNPADPTAPLTDGPSGGSLGYAADGGTPGVPYGYLGFGADVYGNYENSSFSGSGCTGTTPAVAESLGVRGPGNGTVNYCLVSQKQLSSPYTLDDQGATSRTASLAVPEEVVINTTGSTVTASVSGISVPSHDWMFAVEPLRSDAAGTTWQDLEGALPTSPVGVPTGWLNSTTHYPQEVAFGFAASTGGSYEYHQINQLIVNSLTASPTLALTNSTSNSGVITAGGSGTVTLTPSVSSSSVVSEADPVVVTDTFPSSLTPTAASGSGWVCTVTSPSVSCTYTPGSAITAGTTLPPVAITVTASSTAQAFTNTAQVTSQDGAPAIATATGSIKANQTITYGTTAPSTPLVGSTYSVAASSTSSLAVTITVDPSSSSVCSISSHVVTMLSTGTCLLDANQAGNSSYLAATQVQQSFVVDATQTVAFTSTAPAGAVVGGSTYTPTATATSALTPVITVAAGSSSVCTISGGVVSLIGAGTCTLYANQAGNGTYTPATQVLQSFSVAKSPQTVAFTSTAPSNEVVGGAVYTPAASATSALTPVITVASSSSGVCTISSGTVSFVGGGICTLDANQAGNGAYYAATQVLQSFVVANTQVVSFTSTPPSQAQASGATYTPSASTTSGLAPVITVDSSSSSICSISGGVVSFLSAGTCTLDANQAGGSMSGSTYAAAAQVQQSFYVQPPGAVTFTSPAPTNAAVGGSIYDATDNTTDAGTTVYIISLTPSVCDAYNQYSVNQNGAADVSFLAGGLCILQGRDGYNTTGEQSFTVADLQTITFGTTTPTGETVGGSSYTPTASATSSLGVTITVDGSSSGVCAIASGTVTFQASGICTLDANQSGGVNGGLTYAAALQVQQSFAVNLLNQTASFTSTAPSAAVINGTYTPTASATSSLGVIITVDASSSAVCSISGGIVTFNGSGTCTLDTTQNGNAAYAAAPEVQQSFAVAKLSQTLSFSSNPTSPSLVNGTYTPVASATSSLTVAITVDSSSSAVCSINAGLVTFNATGLCVLDANQAGNLQYPAATQVTQAFNVVANQTVSFTSTIPTSPVYGGVYDASASATSNLSPAITVDGSSTAGACTVNAGVVVFTGAGTCVLDANQAGNTNYAPATQAQQSVTIAAAPLTITANPVTITSGGTITPSASAGGLVSQDAVGSVTYTYAGTGSTTYGPSTTAPTAVGVYSITPSNLALSSGHLANYIVTYVAGTLTINALPPETVALSFVTFPTNVTYTGTPRVYPVVATASPNIGTVTYTSTTPSVCTVSASGQVNVLSAGTCTIDANDAGLGRYRPASQISESFTVTAKASTTPTGGGGTGTSKPTKLILTVDFANDSWTLSATAQRQLRAFADGIRRDDLARVTVIGFASSTGTSSHNNVLGTQRANAAASYLERQLGGLNVVNVHFALSGDGATRFLVSPPSAPANRRAQLEANS